MLEDTTTASAGKRRQSALMTDRGSHVKRPKSWLAQGDVGVSHLAWRLRTLYRVSCTKFLANLDNQYKISPGRREGLSFFRYAQGAAPWYCWRKHPFVAVGMDLGPDCCSGIHAAQYFYKLALEAWPDPSHGINNDFSNSVRRVGLKPLLLIMLVSHNLPFGPEDDSARFVQIRAHMRECYASERPSNMPVFQLMASRIADALQASGVAFPAEGSREDHCWGYLRQRTKYATMGTRVSLQGFLGGLHSLISRLPDWWIDCWERTYVAIEEDFLRGKSFNAKLVRPTRHDEVTEGGGQTRSRTINMEVKLLRACCENACAISVMFLSDANSLRYAAIIEGASSELKSWRSRQNKLCRSSDGCAAWIEEQACGGVAQHAWAIFGSLRCRASLEEALFATTVFAAEAMGVGEVVCEDDFADTFGMLASQLVSARLRRLLHITDGFPWSMARLLKPTLAAEAVHDFEGSLRAFRALAAAADNGPTALRLLARHQLHKPSNAAYIQAMSHRAERAWGDDMARLTMTRLRVACPTQIIEDMNGAQKNARAIRSTVRFKRPERSMAIVLKKKIISQRHHWLDVEVDAAAVRRNERLGAECFIENKDMRSMPWGDIVSTSQATTYHSPKAETSRSTSLTTPS